MLLLYASAPFIRHIVPLKSTKLLFDEQGKVTNDKLLCCMYPYHAEIVLDMSSNGHDK